MDKFIYGGDTETCRGKPNMLQFYSEDIACDDIYFVTEDTATDIFIRWISQRKRDVLHVVYVHNLEFDLPEFLWTYMRKLVGPGGDFSFKIRGKWSVRGVYGKPTFCTISNGHDITVMFVDSYSYFRESLETAGKRVCPDLPKLKRPEWIGERRIKRTDEYGIEYARRDAIVGYHLGKAIEAMHVRYNVAQCVSVADMSAKIFRKMLGYTIPQPSRDIQEAALLSYHGGKNNVTVGAGWYEGISSIDISSAYPFAMSEMPAFSDARLYRRYKARRPRSVPPYGIYCVTGSVDKDDWPIIFSHGFKPIDGKIDRVWIQGFEVNEALRSGRLHISRVHGFYYDHEKDAQASALKHFVATFYALKEAEKDAVVRYMFKLILNAISGKFIQTRKRGACAYTDVDAGATVTASDLVAGGMFHPFIASAITAHTRARIHRVEQRYGAIHTATDGIFTRSRVQIHNAGGRNARTNSAAFDLCPQRNGGLGSLTLEADRATLLLIRNKCYVLYVDKPTPKTTPSKVFKGKHILKSAQHGFQGSVTELEKMAATGRRTYTVKRPNRLKSALKSGVTPNDFCEHSFSLKVGPLSVS